ncbi:MAG TPA: acetaldehyde dehydrogenase (acetylating) [Solirubrobacteraceae bacterium]
MSDRARVVIIGSGNIGTDLLAKASRSPVLEVAGVAGIDPDSPGLARAAAAGVATSSTGLQALLEQMDGVELAFDATSAYAHAEHAAVLAQRGIRSIDLTPAALGPAVVPDVNLRAHRDAPDINLVTCGAQATVPVVAAIAAVTEVPYAEIVSSISARSAGPGTRANIDEFTQSTARALESVGGARRGKAIIILNPANPPVLMRNAIYSEVPDADGTGVVEAVERAVATVAEYVPGYRLTAPPAVHDGVMTVLVEVEGAGDNLPRYAGNLDIMTSAAVRVAELQATA